MTVVQDFLQFIQLNESQFDNVDVDLTTLIEKVNLYTPMSLKYSDPQSALRYVRVHHCLL